MKKVPLTVEAEHSAHAPAPRDVHISVVHLAKSFATPTGPREILDDITFDIGSNQLVSIVGPSGAGKTTLLRCIAGLEQPTSGGVYVDGEKVVGPPPQLALVFQDYGRSLFPWLRVIDNVTLPLRSRQPDSRRRLQLGLDALDAVGLADAAHHYPWQLSGGMQQRVAIARALAYGPEALLMDEPFASVDAQTRSDLEDLVLRIRREFKMTVILVTHDVDESVYMADRVLVLGRRPSTIGQDISVHLPQPRDQLHTKSLPEFVALRAKVLNAVQGARG